MAGDFDTPEPTAYEQRTAEHVAQFDDGARKTGDSAPFDEANDLERNELTARAAQPHRFRSEPT